MKLKNVLFFSVSLLLAATPVVQAMMPEADKPATVQENIKIVEPEVNLKIEKPDLAASKGKTDEAQPAPASTEDKKESAKPDEKPAETQSWFKKLGKREALISAGVAATATAVGAASSNGVRNFIKGWTVDPLYNKYQAVKKNGVVKELVTKPILGTAALATIATGGWFGYRWWKNPENEEQKGKVVAQWQQHKKKILISAGLAAASALVWKLLKPNSGDTLSQDTLPQIDPKLQVWFDEVHKGIAEDKWKQVNEAAVMFALYNPNLFILMEQNNNLFNLLLSQEKEAFEEAVKANKYFVSLLNQEQKEKLVGFIREYNQALFKEAKAQLVYLHKEDKAVRKNMVDAKNAQELLALVEREDAKKAFKTFVSKFEQEQQNAEDKFSPSELLEINKNFLARIIYFVKQEEAFAASIKDASSAQKEAGSQKVTAESLTELQLFYDMQLTELRKSFDGTQQELLKRLNLAEALAKADKDPSMLAQLLGNAAFKKVLLPEQIACIELLQALAAQQEAFIIELSANA